MDGPLMINSMPWVTSFRGENNLCEHLMSYSPSCPLNEFYFYNMGLIRGAF